MAGQQPLVSIAVPTYNRASLLPHALTSILRQSHASLEVIVCDNASSDGTAEVVERFARDDPRVRLQRSASNVGAWKNFELGLLLARAEYFMWAADDDLWEPELVTALVNLLETTPDAVLACAEATYMLADGTPLDFVSEGAAFRPTPTPRSLEQRLRALVYGNFDNLVYGLYRRSALLARDGDRSAGTVFDVYGRKTEVNEIPLLLQVAERGDIVVLDRPLWFKRTSPETYRDAAARAAVRTRQPRPRLARLPKAIARSRWRFRHDFAYHRTTLRAIRDTIRTLAIPADLRRELTRAFRRSIYGHLLALERRHILESAKEAND